MNDFLQVCKGREVNKLDKIAKLNETIIKDICEIDVPV